jgi:hypothetical protein
MIQKLKKKLPVRRAFLIGLILVRLLKSVQEPASYLAYYSWIFIAYSPIPQTKRYLLLNRRS